MLIPIYGHHNGTGDTTWNMQLASHRNPCIHCNMGTVGGRPQVQSLSVIGVGGWGSSQKKEHTILRGRLKHDFKH